MRNLNPPSPLLCSWYVIVLVALHYNCTAQLITSLLCAAKDTTCKNLTLSVMNRNRKSVQSKDENNAEAEKSEVVAFKTGFFVPVHPLLMIGRWWCDTVQYYLCFLFSDLLWLVPDLLLHLVPLLLPPLLPPPGLPCLLPWHLLPPPHGHTWCCCCHLTPGGGSLHIPPLPL